MVAMQARVLCALDRYEEAEPLADHARELSAEDDAMSQAFWRQTAALVRASRGEHTEAERLARQAVEITAKTDGALLQGDALFDLAAVLEVAGGREEAAEVFRQALDTYGRKGIIPLARRTRKRLAAIQTATP
jgi:tetratricopeptide (TPR) repeat protein